MKNKQIPCCQNSSKPIEKSQKEAESIPITHRYITVHNCNIGVKFEVNVKK